MILLVAYDISEDKRRTHIADLLERGGERIQYSVFLLPEANAAQLATHLDAMIDPQTDRIHLQPLCQACAQKVIKLGTAKKPVLPDGYRIF